MPRFEPSTLILQAGLLPMSHPACSASKLKNAPTYSRRATFGGQRPEGNAKGATFGGQQMEGNAEGATSQGRRVALQLKKKSGGHFCFYRGTKFADLLRLLFLALWLLKAFKGLPIIIQLITTVLKTKFLSRSNSF